MNVALTINDFIDRGALVYADRVGLIDEPLQPAPSLGDLTYGEVGRLARRQAAFLDELGVGVGERVAVVSHNSGRLLTSFYGVAGSGRILVPINFRLRADEIQYIVDHCGASVLYVDPELDESLGSITAPRRYVLGDDAHLFGSGDADPVAWERDENATATINYTSGTTARPKGVAATHRAIWTNAVTFGLHVGVTDRDVYLHTLPQFHANGWGMQFACAGLGVPQVILRKVDGAEILRRVDAHGVTLMCAAPAVAAAILDAAERWEGEIPGRDRTRIVMAGAPPPSRTIMRIEAELGWEFIQIYGLTETSPLVTVNRMRAEWDGLSAEQRATTLAGAGAPALGVSVEVSPATPDDPSGGELLVRANHVMRGYWENEAQTADALEGGWFHTGDGAEIAEGGYVTIKDRKKDVIITGGENVSSIEVEDVLFSHPGVAEVAVIGVPSEKWGETVKAIVVLDAKHGGPVTEDELIAWCKQRLAGFKAPTSVDFRAELTRTATGKLQKFKLREPYWAGRERQVS
jgi:fatty-acyl-CoA synthase